LIGALLLVLALAPFFWGSMRGWCLFFFFFSHFNNRLANGNGVDGRSAATKSISMNEQLNIFGGIRLGLLSPQGVK
jgi:hypothetical protein